MNYKRWIEQAAREIRQEASAPEGRLEAAQLAWRTKYRKLKPCKKYYDRYGRETTYTFIDWVKESDTEVKTKTTCFTLRNKYVISVFESVTKRQKFLAVSGPHVGKRLTEEQAGEDHVLFNRANRWFPGNKNIPNCVLVHKSSLK